MSRILQYVKRSAQWVGLASSVLTLLIGCIHILGSGASLDWPNYDQNFIADTGKPEWRDKLFSLRPDVFIESWTPFITGVAGIVCHVVQFPKFHCLSRSFFNYFWFLIFQELFATVGFCGGLGILFSIPGFVAAAFAFLGLLLDEDEACLNLNWRFGKLKAGPRDDIFIAAPGT